MNVTKSQNSSWYRKKTRGWPSGSLVSQVSGYLFLFSDLNNNGNGRPNCLTKNCNSDCLVNLTQHLVELLMEKRIEK